MPSDWIRTFPLTSHIINFSKVQLCNVIKSGPVPQHIGFIMDGNRRFAKQRNIEVKEGHSAGFDTMSRLLEICYQCGVKATTVFAFSIENFSRSSYEVDWLMKLAKTKFKQVIERGDLCDEYGVKIRILGNIQMLPNDVRKVLMEAQEMTAGNERAVLNVCIPYTSRDDMTHSIKDIVNMELPSSDINEDLISQHLYTGEVPKLELLIRTSGVHRLSDFMLWEIVDMDCEIEILDKLWPEFGMLDMIWVLIKWSFNKSYYGGRMKKILNIDQQQQQQSHDQEEGNKDDKKTV